ncbi:hypothetical protein GEMRC1_011975 [Eukaryota sp. GEM-RC1]
MSLLSKPVENPSPITSQDDCMLISSPITFCIGDDPSSCSQAFSCELVNGVYHVGIHVLDVTSFEDLEFSLDDVIKTSFNQAGKTFDLQHLIKLPLMNQSSLIDYDPNGDQISRKAISLFLEINDLGSFFFFFSFTNVFPFSLTITKLNLCYKTTA